MFSATLRDWERKIEQLRQRWRAVRQENERLRQRKRSLAAAREATGERTRTIGAATGTTGAGTGTQRKENDRLRQQQEEARGPTSGKQPPSPEAREKSVRDDASTLWNAALLKVFCIVAMEKFEFIRQEQRSCDERVQTALRVWEFNTLAAQVQGRFAAFPQSIAFRTPFLLLRFALPFFYSHHHPRRWVLLI
jgi:hypothetical protein